jgi:hypothetical protein
MLLNLVTTLMKAVLSCYVCKKIIRNHLHFGGPGYSLNNSFIEKCPQFWLTINTIYVTICIENLLCAYSA